MAIIEEFRPLTDVERAEYEREQYLKKKKAAKYHKRWVFVQRLTDGTWEFFTHVWDLKYQKIKTVINGNTGKTTREIEEEILFEIISGQERTLRKLRDMPSKDEAINETRDEQAPTKSSGEYSGIVQRKSGGFTEYM